MIAIAGIVESVWKEFDVSDYQVLKAAGHSPLKAAQVASDAQRGDAFAIAWIKQLRDGRAA